MKRISELSLPFIQEEFIGGISSPLRHVFARVPSPRWMSACFSAKRALSATSPPIWKEYPFPLPLGERIHLPIHSHVLRGGECAWRKILPQKQVKIAI